MAKKMMVVSAHAADFVWRAAGAIAVTAEQGGEVLVVALSYGEKGESGNLWKAPEQTIENVKRIRQAQSDEAAGILGARFQCLDLGDYPLPSADQHAVLLAGIMREFAPEVLLTHAPADPFNPDHPTAYTLSQRARLLSTGAGVASAFERIRPPDLYAFEPHQPELSGFLPNTFIDITAVIEKKRRAMDVIAAQSYLKDYYAELAARRGNHARRISGNQAIQYAEALQRMLPVVVSEL